MSRKAITTRGNAIVGMYPEDFERGHVHGRRGIVRTLCKKSDVAHMTDSDKANFLSNLYYAKEHELRREQLDKKLNKKKTESSRKLETIREASNKWLKEVSTLKDEATNNEYKHSIDLYLSLVGNHKVVDFDRSSNVTFLSQLSQFVSPKTKRPISANTQHKHLRHLKAFLNWCHANEYFLAPKKIIMPEVPDQEMETFTLEQMELIGTYAKAACMGPHRYVQERRFANNILRAYMMAKYSLLRNGAIWSLPLSAIDLEAGYLRIRNVDALDWKPKKMKWPNKPIHPTLFEFLKQDMALRKPSEQYYLDSGYGEPWHSDNTGLSKAMRKVCNRLDLPRHIKPFHWGFRATQITWLLNHGAPPQDVQMLADHSSLTTTLKYRNTRAASQASAVNLLPE